MLEFYFLNFVKCFFIWQFKTHPTDRIVQAVIYLKWTETLNIVFACTGKGQKLRYIIKLLIMEILQWKIKLTRIEKCMRLLLRITSLCLPENLDNKPYFCRVRWKAVVLGTLWAKLIRHLLQLKSYIAEYHKIRKIYNVKNMEDIIKN